METKEVYHLFQSLGGEFSLPPESFIQQLESIRAFVFDWDGVFNSGLKSQGFPSTFHEADSMGLNMLRYGYWLRHQQSLPICVILTGADNPQATSFAEREHFHAICSKVKNKSQALAGICQQYDLKPKEVCYTYDDINDLEVARKVSLRLMVSRKASPLFVSYTTQQDLWDYKTFREGGEQAIRELSELLLGMYQVYDQVVSSRSSFDSPYAAYWNKRQEVRTEKLDFS